VKHHRRDDGDGEEGKPKRKQMKSQFQLTSSSTLMHIHGDDPIKAFADNRREIKKGWQMASDKTSPWLSLECNVCKQARADFFVMC
jgi:hypothetical protein